jgi:hypothetical protein
VAVTEPIRRNFTRTRLVAVGDGIRAERTDSLATEEPLEIRVLARDRSRFRSP